MDRETDRETGEERDREREGTAELSTDDFAMANRFFSHKVTPANFLFVCRRVCMLWKSAKGSQIDRWEDGEMGIYIAAVRHRDREMSIWNVNVIRSLSAYKLTTMLTTVNRNSPHTDTQRKRHDRV